MAWVQERWGALAVAKRLKVLRSARHALATSSMELVDAIPSTLARSRADSYASEVLPLLAACEFLEREAAAILQPRWLGPDGLPFWLGGLDTVVERVPFGEVLVIGPSNYPLFLPGVQALQALAAGNSVVWKPGRGGAAVADVFANAMRTAGLPDHLLRVTDESVEAGVEEMLTADKVFFTGSAQAGREVLRLAAEMVTPVVAELSGCDAVVVLPSADVERVVAALGFGMRFNGSATCMAPRRLLLIGPGHERLIERLKVEFAALPAVAVAGRERLTELLDGARAEGAIIHGELGKPVLVLNALPEMEIARSDIFAPVLTVLHVEQRKELFELDRLCPFALTAAVFGEEKEAREIGAKLRVGTVIVNDLIVPTADPRVPFGGRRGSGFGVTRGREGLLEMTVAKTTSVRTSKGMRHYEQTGAAHEAMFRGLVEMSHGSGVRVRWNGMRQMVSAAMRLKEKA